MSALAVGLVACGKESSGPPNLSLAGVWQCEEVQPTDCITLEFFGGAYAYGHYARWTFTETTWAFTAAVESSVRWTVGGTYSVLDLGVQTVGSNQSHGYRVTLNRDTLSLTTDVNASYYCFRSDRSQDCRTFLEIPGCYPDCAPSLVMLGFGIEPAHGGVDPSTVEIVSFNGSATLRR